MVGLPETKLGEQVAAFLRPKPGQRIDQGELIGYMREASNSSLTNCGRSAPVATSVSAMKVAACCCARRYSVVCSGWWRS